MPKAKIFLVPNVLSDQPPDKIFGKDIYNAIENTNHFIVEHIREARRLLVKLGFKGKLDQITFYELNKHTSEEDISTFLEPAKAGKNIAVISDAGCPGIADPGAEIVAMAHQKNIQVVPLVGPSSILLALISSGLGGQNFQFHGYIGKDPVQRTKDIKKMEANSANSTQIFMETPFRNKKILEDLLNTLSDNCKLCIASNITASNEYIATKSISEWKKTNLPDLNKKPTIFLIRKKNEQR